MFAEIAKKDTQTPYKGGQNTNYSVLAPEATCKIQRASTAFTLPSPLTSAAAVWAASKVRTPLAACSTQRASTALILSSPFRSPRRRPLQTGRRDADPYKRGAESSLPTLKLFFVRRNGLACSVHTPTNTICISLYIFSQSLNSPLPPRQYPKDSDSGTVGLCPLTVSKVADKFLG